MKVNRVKFSFNAKTENIRVYGNIFHTQIKKHFLKFILFHQQLAAAVERHLKISHGTFVSQRETFQNEHRSSAREI